MTTNLLAKPVVKNKYWIVEESGNKVATIQAVEGGVALFQFVHHTQALQVVLKAAERRHAGIECILPGVAKRRVAQVMGQGHRLDQVFVQTQRTGDGATQLRHLQRVGHAGAKQVAFVVQEHLGLVDQTAKCRRVDDAVAVTLVGVAHVGRHQMRFNFCVATTA